MRQLLRAQLLPRVISSRATVSMRQPIFFNGNAEDAPGPDLAEGSKTDGGAHGHPILPAMNGVECVRQVERLLPARRRRDDAHRLF